VSYALDPDAVVAALDGAPPAPAELAALQPADTLLPAAEIAALCFGARASGRVRENVARIDRLLTHFDLLTFDQIRGLARGFASLATTGGPLFSRAPFASRTDESRHGRTSRRSRRISLLGLRSLVSLALRTPLAGFAAHRQGAVPANFTARGGPP
jgi:predicted nucleic acid-binding protein